MPSQPLGDDARADTVMVVIAVRDLYPGVTIEEVDLGVLEIRPEYLSDGVFLSPEHLIGIKPRYRILANEFIRAEQLVYPTSGSRVSAIVPPGMRLVDLPATGAVPVGGAVGDVWWTPPRGRPCAVAQALWVVRPEPMGRVAVLATPAQALQLEVAARSDTFRWVGRHEIDSSIDEGASCSL